MNTIDILNDLADHITIKMNSYVEINHPKDWTESKMHTDYDLWLIIDGNMFIEVNGITYEAISGDLVFFYPELPYTSYMGPNGCRFIYIHFNFNISNNYRILSDFDFSGIIPKAAIAKELQDFKQGWYEYKNSKVSSILIRGYFTILLSAVLNYCSTGKIVSFAHNHKQKSTGKLNALQPVFKYISQNMSTRIKISDLSVVAGMSEKYFINYFRNSIGVTPNIYINQLKMNQARELIYRGKYSVKQIAHMLGYSDQYSFSKAFKKYFNVAPSRFL